MEEEKNAGVSSGMAKRSGSKESDSKKKKKKKSGGKSSKRHSRKKPEAGQQRPDNVEAATATAPGHVESSSPASQKRKLGPDGSEAEEEEIGEVSAENTTGRSVLEEPASGKSDAEGSRRDHGRKAKKIKNENDEVRMEPLASDVVVRQLRPRKQQEIMRHVTLTEDDASRIIGRKIQVFWPRDDKWYPGHVKSFDEKKKWHHVVYDDGDQEFLKLKKERFKLQVFSDETFGKPVQSAGEAADASLADNGKDSKGKAKEDGGAQKHKKTDGNREEEEEEEGQRQREEEEGQRQREEDKEEKRSKNNLGKDESQDEVAEVDQDANMRKNLKRTAPRTKRSGSVNLTHQKHASKGRTESAEKKQQSTEQTDARHTAKQDEEMKLSAAVSLTGDSMDDKGGGKKPKQKQMDDRTAKKNEASGLGGSEQMVDLMDGKQTNVKDSAAVDAKGLKSSNPGDEIQVEKQSAEVESLDDKEAGGIVSDPVEEKETFGRQVPKPCNDDEMDMKSKTADGHDEKDSDAKGHDDKGSGEQEVVKDSDPVSKKHSNKKHRGRAKARETGKR